MQLMHEKTVRYDQPDQNAEKVNNMVGAQPTKTNAKNKEKQGKTAQPFHFTSPFSFYFLVYVA